MEDYARKNGFTNIRHFTDDGIRGTTFKRLGLLKRTFDEYHVRFIAANDNLDTAEKAEQSAKPVIHITTNADGGEIFSFLLSFIIVFIRFCY